MKSFALPITSLLLGSILATTVTAQDTVVTAAALTPKHDLAVLLVAGPEENRAKDYAAFLRLRFARVETATRADFESAKVGNADVVLLDWPQGKEARKLRAEGKTPLGDFEGWTTPTVLLGSAGLNVASAWGVRGGFG